MAGNKSGNTSGDVYDATDIIKDQVNFEKALEAITGSLKTGGTFYLMGNGGSFADCLHIAGELKKSFLLPRPLNGQLSKKIAEFADTKELAENLQQGLRVIVLGLDPILFTGTDNDLNLRYCQFAQELLALGKSGDVALGISTQGNAKNIYYAMVVAKCIDIKTILLTGSNKSLLSQTADIVIQTKSDKTAKIQSDHSLIYHVLCERIENFFFS
jgi:D-sedoheptulose 7-phosphate isomerase